MLIKLHRDMKKTQHQTLEIKTTMSQLVNTLDRTKGRLDTAGDINSELEDLPIRNYSK